MQYCYARIESIIKKSKEKINNDINYNILIHENEIKLIKQLNIFTDIINFSDKNYTIHLIPKYLLTLCQQLNYFYSTCIVISEDKEMERARLLLIRCVQIVIKIGLDLLSIDILEKM